MWIEQKGTWRFASRGFASHGYRFNSGRGQYGVSAHLIKARVLGAGDIIAMDVSDFRLNLAKEFGADYAG